METPEIFLEKPDDELVNLTLANQDNFVYLVRKYESRLTNYIIRISGLNSDEAQDILQDVFIKAYKNLNSFDRSLKFSSWIYRIAHNEVISNYRKSKARGRSNLVRVESDFLENIAADSDLNREIDVGYLKQHVSEALNKLDLMYREVLLLKYIEEKSYQEISDILKKPEGTVATLINRGKKKLRHILIENNFKS